MSDDRVDKETYSFPDKEDEDQYSMSPVGGTESYKSLLKNKRLMMSIGGIIVFYFAVHFMTSFFVSEQKPARDVALSQPAAPVKTPPPVILRAAKTEKMPSFAAKSNLDAMQSQFQAQRAQVEKLSTRLADVEQQHMQTERTLEVLKRHYETNMTAVTHYMRLQQEKAREAQLAAQKLLEQKKAHKPIYTYYTRAAVYGRAWIVQRGTQHNMTVSVGDVVPSYGQVLSIDADLGRIKTTSHRIIRYAPMDR